MPETDHSKTLRQKIMSLLEQGPMSARELSKVLRIQEKLVYEHLVHIDRTVKAKKQKLIIHPAQCSSCHYVFSNRKKFTKPGRCPECRQSHIQAPMYEIK